MATIEETLIDENNSTSDTQRIKIALERLGPAFRSVWFYTIVGLAIGFLLVLIAYGLERPAVYPEPVKEGAAHIIAILLEHLGMGFVVSSLAVFFYEWGAHIKHALYLSDRLNKGVLQINSIEQRTNLSIRLADIIEKKLLPVFDATGEQHLKHSLEILLAQEMQSPPEYLPKLIENLTRLAKSISNIQHDNSWAKDQYIDFISYLLKEVVVENALTLKNVSEKLGEQRGEYQFKVPPTGGEMADKILAAHMNALVKGDGYDVISHLTSWKHLKSFHKETEKAVTERQVQVRRVFNLLRHYPVQLPLDEVKNVLNNHLQNMKNWKNKEGNPLYWVKVLGDDELLKSSSNLRDNISEKHFGIFKYAAKSEGSKKNEGLNLRVNVHKPDLSDMRLSKSENVFKDDIDIFEEAWEVASDLTPELIDQILEQVRLSDRQTIERLNDIERLRKLRGLLNPNLEKVFGDHFSSELNNVLQALETNRITLHNIDDFRLYYKETLIRFPDSEFWATSIPSKTYFWGDPATEEAIEQFIRGGGKMKRIFFLKSREEINDPEAKAIISKQVQMGIEVRIIESDNTPGLYKLFFVESEGRFAWQVTTSASNRIAHVTGTADSSDIENYLQCFKKLYDLSTPFKP
ncbi:MAG TPA: hypothetical protein VF131_26815 [Blastocatellia bacterium]|nr:hypothetical protein [Blastocatellia bacterium]